MSKKQEYIVWASFQRRALSMQPYFNYSLKFINTSFRSKYLKPFEYLYKTWITFLTFLTKKPSAIWLQLPPTIVLHVVFLYRILLNRQCLIIADCHNATFRAPWVKVPGFRFLLEKCDLVLVHNDTVKQQVLDLNISSENLLVLEDPPAIVKGEAYSTAVDRFPRPWIICPCSFNKDEPVNEIFEAASMAPEIAFILTGNKAKAEKNHGVSTLPKNVFLPGFIPTDDFDALLKSADIVMGLTLLDGIQLSVANEAVGVEQPMVLANTSTLKRLFYKGAVYVDPNSANDIASGCREAIEKREELKAAVSELRAERQQGWYEQARAVQKLLEA